MTQPPLDPYGRPMYHVRPVEPIPPMYPGRMRDVDQFGTALVRPRAIVVAFVFWLAAALSWPLGTVVRTLAEDGTFGGFGPVMTLFLTGCLGIAGVWSAILFLGGSYHARLGLVGVSMLIGVLVLAAAIVASRGSAEPSTWVVILSRLVLPVVATVFSFLPGTRYYFSGNLG